MSRPIKISDGLYDRLRKIADKEGMTLQDALAAVTTQTASTAEELLARVKRLEQNIAKAEKRLDRAERGITSAEARAKEMTASLRNVWELRSKDVEAHNSWTPTWERIFAIDSATESLQKRVEALERLSHRHWGQAEKESTR